MHLVKSRLPRLTPEYCWMWFGNKLTNKKGGTTASGSGAKTGAKEVEPGERRTAVTFNLLKLQHTAHSSHIKYTMLPSWLPWGLCLFKAIITPQTISQLSPDLSQTCKTGLPCPEANKPQQSLPNSSLLINNSSQFLFFITLNYVDILKCKSNLSTYLSCFVIKNWVPFIPFSPPYPFSISIS